MAENDYDLGGNHLIVKSIKLADVPHQAGTPVLNLTGAAVAAGGSASDAGATHVLALEDSTGTTYYVLLTDNNA